MDRRFKNSLCGPLLRPPETQVQGGHDEQIQQGGRDQPSQDDDGQRVLDLVPGDIAGDHQGNDRQTASQRGHENRREPFAGARTTSAGPNVSPSCRSRCWKWLIIMIPLRAAIPRIVKNPTSEPSEMTPSAKYTARTPPTSAEGSVKNESVARRQLPKDVTRSR